jgi:hypothetical protein
LPGINGVELVPLILEIEPNMAILMLTAVNDATSAALCMTASLRPIEVPSVQIQGR